jgi:HK97 family phage major capsid protein
VRGAAREGGPYRDVTTAIGSGTALLGSFKQAVTLYRRGGLGVEISNSHADHFVNDLNAVRAESRAALAVFRPSSFVRGTALAA